MEFVSRCSMCLMFTSHHHLHLHVGVNVACEKKSLISLGRVFREYQPIYHYHWCNIKWLSTKGEWTNSVCVISKIRISLLYSNILGVTLTFYKFTKSYTLKQNKFQSCFRICISHRKTVSCDPCRPMSLPPHSLSSWTGHNFQWQMFKWS